MTENKRKKVPGPSLASLGIISIIAGVISSILGAAGACVICLPICGGICISGLLTAILGAGIVGFLHKFGIWFVIIGGIVFILGLYLIIKNRRRCKAADVQKYLEALKKHYQEEKCRACDCLQELLSLMEKDEIDDKTKKEIESMKIPQDQLHACLGCNPCPPAEIFFSY